MSGGAAFKLHDNVTDKRRDNAGDIAGRIAWLGGVALFKDLVSATEGIEYIARLMVTRQYKLGETIVAEGEAGDVAFFLTKGRVKVQKGLQGGESFPVAILKAEDHPVLGEAALLARDMRGATILAEIECECLLLRKDDFDKFCAEHPQWALPVVLAIARTVIQRLHRSNNDVVLLYHALLNEVRGWHQ